MGGCELWPYNKKEKSCVVEESSQVPFEKLYFAKGLPTRVPCGVA